MNEFQIPDTNIELMAIEEKGHPFSVPLIYKDSTQGNAVLTGLKGFASKLHRAYVNDADIDYIRERFPQLADTTQWIQENITPDEKKYLAKLDGGTTYIVQAQKGEEEELKRVVYNLNYRGFLVIPNIAVNGEWLNLEKMFIKDYPSLVTAVQEFKYLNPDHIADKEFRYALERGACDVYSRKFESLCIKRGVITYDQLDRHECGVRTVNWEDETHSYFFIGNIGIDWTRFQIDGKEDFPYVFKIGSKGNHFYDYNPKQKLNSYEPIY